jgi:hypothetical protein
MTQWNDKFKPVRPMGRVMVMVRVTGVKEDLEVSFRRSAAAVPVHSHPNPLHTVDPVNNIHFEISNI